MRQLGFFGDGIRTLVDDASGRITYMPELVDPTTGWAWFEALQDTVGWRTERRRMYDRDVDVPRKVASYRLSDPELPPTLAGAARLIRDATGVRFNSVGLNFYRDERDSVAPHNDHLYEIVKDYPIALLSLGSARRMTIRTKTRPRRAFDLDLEHGSLLLMSYETQRNYDHGIPKGKTPVGARISVAFRVRPNAEA
ncbi:MAG: alpha-ketoglutarate-dependent dioxygenase AlkB [Candidatus Eremiobacteraeota bacterium]|nr:alpha-ketoglutarate-dependent dioxygenase AlkB [Candidatus Eremiobacteraeota bacterium]